MNIGSLLWRRLRRADRIDDRLRRFYDVRLLRKIRILRLLNHDVIRASGVPAT